MEALLDMADARLRRTIPPYGASSGATHCPGPSRRARKRRRDVVDGEGAEVGTDGEPHAMHAFAKTEEGRAWSVGTDVFGSGGALMMSR
jgi:hypothetical protein